jgi:hypothetical protein
MKPEKRRDHPRFDREGPQVLSGAELLLENGSDEATINRRTTPPSAPLSEHETPSLYAGLIQWFGYHFVRTECVSEEIGGNVIIAASTRGEEDYDVFSEFDKAEAGSQRRPGASSWNVQPQKQR